MKIRLASFITTISLIFWTLICIGIGIIFGMIIESNTGVDSIAKQHQVLITNNENFKYCPYCGEKIGK